MRTAIVVLILGLTFSFCSKPKAHQTVDPVLIAAKELVAVGTNDPRASDKLKILEIEIEKVKNRETARDIRAWPLYDRAIEMFRLSQRKDGKESEELWVAAVNQLHKAQLVRMGLQNISPVFYDPPMPGLFYDPPMPRPVKQKGIGDLR